MPGKVCPKLLIEGTGWSRRAELCAALARDPRVVGAPRSGSPSPMISSSWPGLGGDGRGRGLVDFEPAAEARAMEAFAGWAHLFELLPFSPWLADRFHLSTLAYQAARGRAPDFGWLEQRLRPLGFRVILCTVGEAALASARPGARADELDGMLAEQEALRRAAEDSILPCLEVDVSDGDVDRAAEQVADWLQDTGGLAPPWVNDVWLGAPSGDPRGAEAVP